MRGTRNPNAEEHPPPSPLQRGERAKAKGGCYPFKGGGCGAVSHQQTACGMPCRGEPQCSPFFLCGVGNIRTQISQMTQINANNCVCHSAPPFVIPNTVRNLAGKREEILRFALNDKLIVNCQWLIVMRGTRRIMYLENNN